MNVEVHEQTCLHKAYRRQGCLIISRAFYTAFLFASCHDGVLPVDLSLCFDPTLGTMSPYISMYFRGGVWISTNHKTKFDSKLPYFNAPPTGREVHVLPLTLNRSLTLIDAEVFQTPTVQYRVEFPQPLEPTTPPPPWNATKLWTEPQEANHRPAHVAELAPLLAGGGAALLTMCVCWRVARRIGRPKTPRRINRDAGL